MPSINLRLSEQQHADLERWAKDGHRSLQKEIIWRLFAVPDETYITSSAGLVTPQGREAAREVWTGNTDLLDALPQTAPRGACQMNVPRGTKCKVCGKVHPL